MLNARDLEKYREAQRARAITEHNKQAPSVGSFLPRIRFSTEPAVLQYAEQEMRTCPPKLLYDRVEVGRITGDGSMFDNCCSSYLQTKTLLSARVLRKPAKK